MKEKLISSFVGLCNGNNLLLSVREVTWPNKTFFVVEIAKFSDDRRITAGFHPEEKSKKEIDNEIEFLKEQIKQLYKIN